MEQIFISSITIDKVRHLENIKVDLSEKRMKHLLLTGKNGSGKTSLLDAIAVFLNSITKSNDPMEAKICLEKDINNLKYQMNHNVPEYQIAETKKRIQHFENRIQKSTNGIMLKLNCGLDCTRSMFEQGEFIVAYYKAERVFQAAVPRHVEKITLKSDYSITDAPREDFIKYLLDLKMTQALAIANGKKEKANQIEVWFNQFEELLKKIFESESARLEFDEDTFGFQIRVDGREPFDFNTLSSGYAAVLDIVVDLIMRMESRTNRVFDFSVPGIVLIDEIETHLHLELQKKILILLTTIFPNVQFIVTTHSPFILNSMECVVIYDLEKKLMVENGLADVPYEGVVKGYFDSDTLSMDLRKKYDRYKELAVKPKLTDNDFEEIAELELYLDEIPDYLAIDITTEYQRMKTELRHREDI